MSTLSLDWSPVADTHAALRAVPGELHGGACILSYGDVPGEYAAVRHAVGLLDLSARGRFRVSGRDAVSFLQRMLSNNIAARPSGAGCHALFLSDLGQLRLDLQAYRVGEEVWLECEVAQRAAVIPTLEAFVIMDEVRFEDVTGTTAQLSLQGPRAAAVLQAARLLPSGLDALYAHAVVDAETVHPRVVRRDRGGETGYDLWMDAAVADTVLNELLRVGGPQGLAPVGELAAEILRIETGRPRWNADLTAKTLPVEARLEDALDYDKGCYAGQEAVARSTFVGRVQWLLAAGVVDGADVPAVGAELYAAAGDESIGRVTSAVFSPALQAPLVLVRVRRAFAEPGRVLRLSGDVGVRVVARPPVTGGGLVPLAPPHPLTRKD